MTRRDQILRAIYDVVDELNHQLPPDERMAADPDTVIVGPKATLDSLGLVNLMVAAESRLRAELAPDLNLTDALAAGPGEPAFRTLGEMADYAAAQTGSGDEE
jgi:acyl carrier protein